MHQQFLCMTLNIMSGNILTKKVKSKQNNVYSMRTEKEKLQYINWMQEGEGERERKKLDMRKQKEGIPTLERPYQFETRGNY